MDNLYYNYNMNYMANKIMINELDGENNKSSQPNNINISLKPHQLTALYQMNFMETNKKIILNK